MQAHCHLPPSLQKLYLINKIRAHCANAPKERRIIFIVIVEIHNIFILTYNLLILTYSYLFLLMKSLKIGVFTLKIGLITLKIGVFTLKIDVNILKMRTFVPFFGVDFLEKAELLTFFRVFIAENT